MRSSPPRFPWTGTSEGPSSRPSEKPEAPSVPPGLSSGLFMIWPIPRVWRTAWTGSRPTSGTEPSGSLRPPLVIEVEGQDLRPASMAELLEGGQKIVLVVNGPAAPAPLVRLITPGVTVIQTDDPAELSALGAVAGPGIAALMPEGAAKFMHLPGKGRVAE